MVGPEEVASMGIDVAAHGEVLADQVRAWAPCILEAGDNGIAERIQTESLLAWTHQIIDTFRVGAFSDETSAAQRCRERSVQQLSLAQMLEALRPDGGGCALEGCHRAIYRIGAARHAQANVD